MLSLTIQITALVVSVLTIIKLMLEIKNNLKK